MGIIVGGEEGIEVEKGEVSCRDKFKKGGVYYARI